MTPAYEQLGRLNAFIRAAEDRLDRTRVLARQSQAGLLSSRMSLALAAECLGRARALIAYRQGRRGSAWPAPAEPAS